MEAGQLKDKNIGFIIQVRMGSTRLPGKSLMPIPLAGGQPVLKYVFEEITKSFSKENFVVATSDNQLDDVLESYCIQEKINYFRGNEDDVLSRFLEIQKKHNFNHVVRLTGDNPILDLDELKCCLNFHITNKNYYTKSEGLPIGMNFEVMSQKALQLLNEADTDKDEKEHVTLWLNRNNALTKGTYITGSDYLKSLRTTVDYPTDFLVMSTVISVLLENDLWGIDGIEYIMKNQPWVFKVNQENYQVKIDD